MKDKTPMNTDTYDFGFSFADEAELAAPQKTSVEELYKARLQEVEKLILPLLYNLMKNPEKPIIKWENRVPVIEEQIKKITAITRS